MQSDLTDYDLEAPMPPSHWGDTRQHVFYGALYHWFIMFANRAFPHFKPHRDLTVVQEFRLHLRSLLLRQRSRDKSHEISCNVALVFYACDLAHG